MWRGRSFDYPTFSINSFTRLAKPAGDEQHLRDWIARHPATALRRITRVAFSRPARDALRAAIDEHPDEQQPDER